MSKVNLKVAPVARLPELKAADFIVCVAESLLVQVTVVPFFTVSVSGLKAKFWILTVFVLVVSTAEDWLGVLGDALGVAL